MKRRDLLLKFFKTAGATLLCSNIPAFTGIFSLRSGSQNYPCILDCEIPSSLTVEEYFEKKYTIYSFHEIKCLVDSFKQNGQLLSEHRVVENGSDRWYATFRSRQDFLGFIRASQTLGLDQKQKKLFDLHGFKQSWALPS